MESDCVSAPYVIERVVRFFRSHRVWTHFSSDSCGTNWTGQQIPHAHEVVSGGREGEHPPDSPQSPMPRLAQHAHRFQPTVHFFDPLPLALANLVSAMPRRSRVDRAAARTLRVLRYMRRDLLGSHLPHELLGVIPLVRCQRHPMRTW